MFEVTLPVSRQFVDTPNCVLEDHVHYSMVHIQDVFCLKYCIFVVFCTVIVRCTETF